MPQQSQKITFNGALNSDIDPQAISADGSKLFPAGDYTECVNLDNTDAISGKLGAMVSLMGNRLIANTQPAGTNKVIGKYYHKETQKLYRFVWNSNNYDHIIETDAVTLTTSFLITNLTNTDGVDLLNFNPDYLILHVNIKRGLLYWVEGGWNEARKINIARAKSGGYGVFTDTSILAAKPQPLIIPVLTLSKDEDVAYSNIRGKMFYARSQYVYDDNESSAWSSISKRPFNTREKTPYDVEYPDSPWDYNTLEISINTGPKEVRLINIAVSDNDQMIFNKVVSVDKDILGLADNATYVYNFYNDVNGVVIAQEDSLLAYDYFPEKPKIQELLNDDIIAYGNFMEGKDNLEIAVNLMLNYIEPDAYMLGEEVVPHIFKTFKTDSVYRFGIKYKDNIGREWLVQSNDDCIIKTPSIQSSHNMFGQLTCQVSHQPPLNAVQWLPVLTKNTRKSNYVQLIVNVFPAYDKYANTGTSSEYIYLNIQAMYDSIQEGKMDSLGYEIIAGDRVTFINNIDSATGDESGVGFLDTEILDVVRNETRYPTGEISNTNGDDIIDGFILGMFTEELYLGRSINILGESYRVIEILGDGDKIKVDRSTPSFEFLHGWYVNYPETFLKIRKATFEHSSHLFIEVYKQNREVLTDSDDSIYYEIGISYPIISPGTENRRHAGVIDQDGLLTPAEILITGADCYLRPRGLAIIGYTETGTIKTTKTLLVEDQNFSDYYDSKLYDYGKYSAVNKNAKRLHRPATYRYSRPYIADTNINGLSRFYPGNVKNYEEQYGEILFTRYNNRMLTCMQELKVGKIMVRQNVLSDLKGSQNIIKSDEIMGDIQYSPSGFGIGRNPESYSTYDDFEYFVDANSGVVCLMKGLDIVAISEKSLYSKYWTNKLKQVRESNGFALGYVDPERKKYILTMPAKGSVTADTVVLDISKQRFVFHPKYLPEMGGQIGNKLCTFKDGKLWLHDEQSVRNNFYGTQYDAYVVAPFNELPDVTKVLTSMKYRANLKIGISDILVPGDERSPLGMKSRITPNLFQYSESGDYFAPFLRDMLTPHHDPTITEAQKLFEGRDLRGKVALIKYEHQGSGDLNLFSSEVYYSISHPA